MKGLLDKKIPELDASLFLRFPLDSPLYVFWNLPVRYRQDKFELETKCFKLHNMLLKGLTQCTNGFFIKMCKTKEFVRKYNFLPNYSPGNYTTHTICSRIVQALFTQCCRKGNWNWILSQIFWMKQLEVFKSQDIKNTICSSIQCCNENRFNI